MMRSAVLTQITRVTDGQTYGIGIAYTRYSIYAVARKKKRGMKSMHIFIKVGVRLRVRFFKGRKIKLLKHVFALYSLPYHFLKKFRAHYARSIAFYPPLKNASMQCALPTPFVFFIFGVIL